VLAATPTCSTAATMCGMHHGLVGLSGGYSSDMCDAAVFAMHHTI
jgi:hypothetical protein